MTQIDNDENIKQMAHYILDNSSTIRATAQYFHTPKSTVHHNLSIKLKHINPSLHAKVKTLLENNFKTKHIHGGESTKNKYLKLKAEINKNDELDIFTF